MSANNVSKSKILDELNERVIKSFLDIVVMSKLKTEALSGYDFIAYINRRFDILISAGTVYSLLYSLERKQLIEGSGEERGRTYKLTKKGNETIDIILKENRQIEAFLANLLKPQ
ncbi:MAG: PadR family transcriptional regulator [Candidatus Bathyarchaeia archaeon]